MTGLCLIFFVNEQCGERKKCCFVAINVQFNILLQKKDEDFLKQECHSIVSAI